MSRETLVRRDTNSPNPSREGSISASQASQKIALDDDPSRIWDDLPKKYRCKKRGAYIRRHNDFKVSSNYQKFKLLLWKNYIVTKRRWVLSLIQFCAPIFFTTVLVIYLAQQEKHGYTTRTYKAFPVDTVAQGTFKNCDKIYLWPRHSIIAKLKEHLEERFADDEINLKIDYYKSLKNTPNPQDTCAMIEFQSWNKNDGILPPNLRYDIRFPAVYDSNGAITPLSIGKTWDTQFFYAPMLVGGAREVDSDTGGHPGYYELGFLYIQNCIAAELTEMLMIQEAAKYNISEDKVLEEVHKFQDKISVRLRRFPFPEHENDVVTGFFHGTLPTFLVVGFGVSSVVMVYLSVSEKEMRTRTLLKLYGVDNTAIKFAWVLHNWFFLSLAGILITIILSTKWTNSINSEYIISEKYLSELFFMLIFSYIFNIVCSSTFLSYLFESASTACISVSLISTLMYVPYIYIKRFVKILTAWEIAFALASPHTALGMGLLVIAELQCKKDRAGWSKLFDKAIHVGPISVCLMGSGLLQLMFALYISRVFPEKGMPKMPWNYVFKSWYWKEQLPPNEAITVDMTEVLNEPSYEEQNPEYFENDDDTKKRRELSVENVSKNFGRIVALHRVNFVCFQDYVTVLLGDAGSGKSLLLNIVNGSVAPSNGMIYLSRKDMSKNPDMGRAFIGYCPKGNLLFPDLTVEETLQFFTDIKGVSNRIEAYEEVERFLKITTLQDCRDTIVSNLTRSSRRMLMVATAFVGGSRVVLLDDPTQDLSATQQRVLWDFMEQEKKHRTIVVAMANVNEVDSVADKIVLLGNGQVTARGSPDFLRERFGGGYHLVLETMSFFDEDDITDLVARRVNNSFLQSKTKDERVFDYYLPHRESGYFPGLLEELERYKLSYGISKIRILSITLDELYLSLKRMQTSGSTADGIITSSTKIAARKTSKSRLRITQTDSLADFLFPEPEVNQSGCNNFCKEFYVMFLKNVRFTFRDTKVCLLSILAPLVMLMLIHLITLRLELPEVPARHSFNKREYWKPRVITDMAEATNEGVFLRTSISTYLKRKKVVHKDITYEESILQEILTEHIKVTNENDLSKVGLEIFQSKEAKTNRTIPDGSRSKTVVKVGFTGYFNNQVLHSPGVSLSLVHNILLFHIQKYLGRKLIRNYDMQNFNLDVSNHPLPYQPSDQIKYTEILSGPGYLFGVFVTFSFSFHFPFYIIMHVKEERFRHLQMMFGANKIIFWGANYLWNQIYFNVVVICFLAFLWVAEIPGFQNEDWNVPRLMFRLLLFLELYGITSIFVIGAFASLNFRSWGIGFANLALFFVLTGPLAMLLMILLKTYEKTFTVLHNIFLLFPSYSFGTGIFYILANEALNTECQHIYKYNPQYCDSRFSPNPFNEFSVATVVRTCCFNRRDSFLSFIAYGVGRNVCTLCFAILISVLLKIWSYSKRMRKWKKKKLDKKIKKWKPIKPEAHEIKNYDVLAETVKVFRRNTMMADQELIIRNLTVESPECVKLDNICVEFESGDCFSLLGSTGAGKTAFLQTVSGYPSIMPAYGDVEFNGLSLLKNYDKYLACLSYCPDHNPFLNQLTGQETLELLGTLRRLSNRSMKAYIEKAAATFDIVTELKKKTKNCGSLVVKKLSATAALMGRFRILLLDNPTSNLDWRSKQIIVTNVKRLMEQGCIVIWASDGIEHCDTLCTKMSILVNGHLRCFGSLDHLRDMYETGFTVVVKFALDKDLMYFTSKKNIWMENEMRETEIDEETGLPITKSRFEERKKNLLTELDEDEDVEKALDELTSWEQDLCTFIAFFERAFPTAILVDKQPAFIHYHVHQTNGVSWFELFRKMEEAKTVADVYSYYICCATLEQVYYNFTRGQKIIDSPD